MTLKLYLIFIQMTKYFHKAFISVVVCREGTFTPPDTLSRPGWDFHTPFGDQSFPLACRDFPDFEHLNVLSRFYLCIHGGHLWRVRRAKQETLTPPGHLVSPLVCRGPWMSTVVLYCWCHSDSTSVLLYFTSEAEGVEGLPCYWDRYPQ